MRVYQIRENGFNEVKKKLIIRMVPLLVIASTVGILIASINSKHEADDVSVLPVVIPIMALFVGYRIYRGLNRQKTLFESYKLTIGDDLITREQLNTPTISIHFNDIVYITKDKNACLAIKGKGKEDVIFVPAQIDNYQEMERILQGIWPIGNKEGNSFLEKFQSVLGIVALGLMICVFTLNNKIVVALTGSILITILTWSATKIWNSKNVDSKTRKSLWWIFLVMAMTLASMIFKLTRISDTLNQH